ncbi:hypothetical protein ACU61A_25310 [Pseudonocardia sichuanensis]|uniref:Small secreted domain DUF320 n=1 Tax=Pseudonocardia kunmingensis TaxID=630975 RepID=A0A543DJY0_9PSEU|nr:hypothetical protein [Pseudonocardia kunmingensis]TQM09636.1 hypothetical protein FB558_5402 [Pseudonocardia kunmingensis]
MLKKAGIVVAAAAAGLLAVSPLAFAGDGDDDHGSKTKVEDVNSIDGSASGGLLNLGGNNVTAPVNACGNHVPVNVLGVQVPLNGTTVLAELSGAASGLIGGESESESENSGDNTIDDSCKAAGDAGDSAEIDD